MDNLNQPQTKKDAIKRLVLMLLIVSVFSPLLVFITLGRIPVKGFLISLVLVLLLMTISAIWGFKNKRKITENQTYINKLYIFLGVLSVLIELSLIFIGERGLGHYVGIGAGICFIYYGFKKLNKK